MNTSKKISKQLLCILATILFTTNNVLAQSTIAAEIPVSYNVSQTGSFTYQLPIRIPPGIKDMVPSIGIAYNSQGANSGIMGAGWNITGLSSISRGANTIYHNTAHDPVDFDGNDNFLLDGQILYATNVGSGWVEYATWIKNFAKIKGYWVTSTGFTPDYFTVEYPNGVIYEYGNNSNTKMLAQGKSDVFMWAVNKIYDRSGNYMEFEYHYDQANGEYRILKIKYTGNSTASVLPPSEVNFKYFTKADENRTWFSGSIVQDKVALEYIEIKQNGTTVNRYDFTYNTDFYLQLTKIQETRAGVSLPDINIYWGGTTVGSSTSSNNYGPGPSTYAVGDFNGDGATDYITTPILGIPFSTFEQYTNDKSSTNTFTHTNTVLTGYSGGSVTPMTYADASKFMLDYNGDGYDDIFLIRKTGTNYAGTGTSYFEIFCYLSNGTTFSAPASYMFQFTNSEPGHQRDYVDLVRVIQGDFDGNGKKDILVFTPSAIGSVASYDVKIIGHDYGYSSWGCGTDGWVTNWNGDGVDDIPHEIGSVNAGDFDGDGKTDFLITNPVTNLSEFYTLDIPYNYSKEDTKPYLPSPNLKVLMGVSTHPSAADQIRVGDFNGDGKSDLLTCYQSTYYGSGLPAPYIWDISYSTGDFSSTSSLFSYGGGSATWFGYGTSMPPNMSPKFQGYEPLNILTESVLIADFNGDGRDDICKLHLPATPSGRDREYDLFYCKGFDNFVYETGTLGNFSSQEAELTVGDFNADGQADLMCHMAGSTSYTPTIAYFTPNDVRGVVTSIEHAGKTVTASYTSLAQMTDYVYEPTIAIPSGKDPRFPHVSAQIPVRVVNDLSDGMELHNTYRYSTAISNFFGLGFRGFIKIISTDIIGSKITINKYPHIPRNANVFTLQSDSTWDLSTYNDVIAGTKPPFPYTLPITSHMYGNLDIDGDNGGQVRIILNAITTTTDYRNGTTFSKSVGATSTTPGSHFFDTGAPDYTVEENGAGGFTNTVSTYTALTYNLAAPFYNSTNPISSSTTITRVGKPAYIRNAEFQYNTEGLVSQSKADPGTPNEKTTTYTYDVFGNITGTNLTAASGITGSVTDNFVYSTDGRFKIQSTNTLNYTSSSTYNDWGAVLSHTNINGFTSLYEYDAVNRLTKFTDHLGISTLTRYDRAYTMADNPTGGHLAVTNSTSGISGNNIVFTDFYGKKLRTVSYNFNGTKLYTDTRYLANGLVDYTTLPYNSSSPSTAVKSTFDYDPSDRVYHSTNSVSGTTIETTYNVVFNISGGYNVDGMDMTVKNLATSQQKISYSHSSGTQYKIDDNGNSIEYDYNSNGNLDEQKVNSSFVTTYQYDPYGNLKEINEPNAGNTKYSYNALGLVTQKNENSKGFSYIYDKLDRLIQSTEPGVTGSYTYTYDNTLNMPSTGQITQKVSPYGTQYDYTYNGAGQLNTLIQTIGSNVFVSGYTYDGHGRLVTQQYPSGDKIQNNYNAYGFHESIDLIYTPSGTSPHRLWQLNGQNNIGLTTQSTYYDNSGTALYRFDKTYDALGLPTTRKLKNLSNNNTFVDFRYSFDNTTGNLTYREDFTRSLREDFQYDPDFDRLTQATNNISGSPILDMEYDINGNITHKSDVSDPLNYSPPVPKFDWIYNQYALSKVQSPQTSVPAYAIPQATQQVWYYPFNKIQKVSEGSKQQEFIYWPDEQRAVMEEKTYTGTTLRTRHYATQYEKTVDAVTGNVEELDYVFGGGEPIAFLQHKTVGTSSTFNIFYPITDYLGSITHILDDQGTTNNGLLEERSFDAWGRYRNPSSWVPYTSITMPTFMFDRGYTGHEHLNDFNIINMNGRLYDPLIGRMFSVDPYVSDNTNSQAHNKYSYVNNNPLKYADPSGYFAVEAIIFVGAAVGIINAAMQSKKGNVHSTWDGFKAFYIGGLAGSSSAYAGAVVAPILGGGFVGGSMVGAVSGSSSGMILNAGNSWNNGANFGAGIKQGLIGNFTGGIMGAITGGLMGGANDMINGRDFWTGNEYGTLPSEEGTSLSGEDYEFYYASNEVRPDADGYLTNEEAQYWYHHGNGVTLNTQLNKVDLSGVYSDDFPGGVGSKKSFNLFEVSNSSNDAKVYGHITLKLYPNNTVRAYQDNYNFEWHKPILAPSNWYRNLGTAYGRHVIGGVNSGIPFKINLLGSQTIFPHNPVYYYGK